MEWKRVVVGQKPHFQQKIYIYIRNKTRTRNRLDYLEAIQIVCQTRYQTTFSVLSSVGRSDGRTAVHWEIVSSQKNNRYVRCVCMPTAAPLPTFLLQYYYHGFHWVNGYFCSLYLFIYFYIFLRSLKGDNGLYFCIFFSSTKITKFKSLKYNFYLKYKNNATFKY